MARKEHGIEHRLTPAYPPQTAGMMERFNRRVRSVLKYVHFKSQWALTETMHGYVNHYNHRHRQSQAALGRSCTLRLLEPCQAHRGETTRREPAYPPAACVMSENTAPDPTILKQKEREVQENAITTCHPQSNQEYSDNDPYSYTSRGLVDYRKLADEILKRLDHDNK